MISSRVRQVSGVPETLKTDLLKFNHRGFTKLQPNSRISRDGDVTLEFTDFEDSTIVAWMKSWSELQSDPETNLGLRAEFNKCDLILTRLNRSLNSVHEVICKSGFLKNTSFDNSMENDQSLISTQKMTIGFEHIKLNLLNT